MIWLKSHIDTSERLYNDFFRNLTSRYTPHINSSERLQISVVGGGPKGLYAVDSLFKALHDKKYKEAINLHWWNASSQFGAGPNYCIHQPEYWLINICIAHVDAWLASPIRKDSELSFMQWLDRHKLIQMKPQSTDYASRALVGCYLQYVAFQVLQNIPDQVELILYKQTVKKIYELDETLLILESASEKCVAHNILLATGHCYSNQSILQNKEQSQILSTYINSIYPASQLDPIPACAQVGVVGMGLSFIDTALHLTEGRGGVFDNKYRYQSSGDECYLYPFSRHNLLMIPRGPVLEESSYKLKFLTEEWQDNIRGVSKLRKLDFINDILPLLSQEFEFAYYSTLLSNRDEMIVQQYVEQQDWKDRFDLHDFIFKGIDPAFTGEVHSVEYVDYMIDEAEKGELYSPIIAASAVWRIISPFVSELYAFGGFDGVSQQLLDLKYFGAFNRVAYGPPIVNMRKIASLIHAGYIKLKFDSSVEVTYQPSIKMYVLNSNRHTMEMDYIVDARIARPDLNKSNSSLYNYMWQQNLIEPMDNQGYQPGCMQLDGAGSTAIKSKKYSIYAYGTNTEGTLLDNDSLSRVKNNLGTNWVQSILCKIKQKREYYESKK